MWSFISSFLIEMIERLKAENPPWFNKLRIVVVVMTVLFSGLQLAIAKGFLLQLSGYMDSIYTILACLTTAFGLTFFAKKDPQVTTMDGPGGPIPPPSKPDPRG